MVLILLPEKVLKISKKKKFETLIQMEEDSFSPIYDEKEKDSKL